MRRAVLFIASVFVFTACAAREPVMTVKAFDDFENQFKKAWKLHSEAETLSMTRINETRNDLGELEKLVKILQKIIGLLHSKVVTMDMNTTQAFTLVGRALEHKGIKINWEKEAKLLEKEMLKEMEKQKLQKK